MAGEMLRHLEELATRYYAGDALVVDEFLQLYCLDATRPNDRLHGREGSEAE